MTVPNLGNTDLMEIHAVVSPAGILVELELHRERYIETLGDVKKICEARTERYIEALREWKQKEIDGDLTDAEKRAKPEEPEMPRDRTKTYDKFIALYKATQVETVYLSEQHFAEFFLDEWDFIRAHIIHLRSLRAGGSAMFLNEDLSAMAADALSLYSS